MKMSPLLQPMTAFVTLLNEKSKEIIDEDTTYKKSNQIIPYQQYFGHFQPGVVPPTNPNFINFSRLWDSIIQINTSPTVKVIPANLYFAPDFSKYSGVLSYELEDDRINYLHTAMDSGGRKRDAYPSEFINNQIYGNIAWKDMYKMMAGDR